MTNESSVSVNISTNGPSRSSHRTRAHLQARRRAHFRIRGMTCAGCVATLTNYLKKKIGVLDVHVTLIPQAATVTYNSNEITAEIICKQIKDTGFEAELFESLPLPHRSENAAPVADDRDDAEPVTLRDTNWPDKEQVIRFKIVPLCSTLTARPKRRLMPPKLKQFCNVLLCRTATRCAHSRDLLLQNLSTSLLEKKGVKRCSVHLAEGLLKITLNPVLVHPVDVFLDVKRTLGTDYVARPIDPHKDYLALEEYRTNSIRFFACLFPACAVSYLTMCHEGTLVRVLSCKHSLLLGLSPANFLTLGFASFVYFFGGKSMHFHAKQAIRTRTYSMDLLISLASTITFGYSCIALLGTAALAARGEPAFAPHYFETPAVVITAVLLGRLIECRARISALKLLNHYTENCKIDCDFQLIGEGGNCEGATEKALQLSNSQSGTNAKTVYERDLSVQVTSPVFLKNDHCLPHSHASSSYREQLDVFPHCSRYFRGPKNSDYSVAVKEEISSDFLIKRSCHLLGLGDLVVLLKGDTIPADGFIEKILASNYNSENLVAYVDEAILTGEAKAVSKHVGDKVLHGSKLLSGDMLMRITEIGNATAVGRVQAAVDSAVAARQPSQTLIDDLCALFIPCVLGMALLTLVVWAGLILSRVVDPVLQDCGVRTDQLKYMARSAIHHDFSSGSPLRISSLENIFLRILFYNLFILQFPISVISLACPCSLGLAAPVAIAIAVGLAARRGALIQHTNAFDRATLDFKAAILDKTGTLTTGTLSVTNFVAATNDSVKCWFNSLNLLSEHFTSDGVSEGISKPDLSLHVALGNASTDTVASVTTVPEDIIRRFGLWAAASLEQHSDHPLARAIASYYVQQFRFSSDSLSPSAHGQMPPLGIVTDIEEFLGAGISGFIECARLNDKYPGSKRLSVSVGNLEFCRQLLPETTSLEMEVRMATEQQKLLCLMESSPSTTAAVLVDTIVVGFFEFSDIVRPEAAEVVELLQSKTGDVWLCTGDAKCPAMSVCEVVGIPQSRVIYKALPSDKEQLVRRLRDGTMVSGNSNGAEIRPNKTSAVLMVGDGINDASALATASFGVAMMTPQRSALAMTSADLVLLNGQLKDLLYFFELSSSVRRVIFWNLLWGVLFNLLGLPVAAGLLYPRVMLPASLAGLFMAGSSIFVILNTSFQLLHVDNLKSIGRFKTWRQRLHNLRRNRRFFCRRAALHMFQPTRQRSTGLFNRLRMTKYQKVATNPARSRYPAAPVANIDDSSRKRGSISKTVFEIGTVTAR